MKDSAGSLAGIGKVKSNEHRLTLKSSVEQSQVRRCGPFLCC